MVRGKGAGSGSTGGFNTAGGSYGGLGGTGSSTQFTSNPAYGSVTTPTDCGSGGGSTCCSTGGTGGGALYLVVASTLTVEGAITADGADSVAISYWPGGGSGGSLWLDTFILLGTGLIHANGGAGGGRSSPQGGGGSGGR